MSGLFVAALALIAAGAVLPIWAFVWAWRSTRSERDDLDDRLRRVGELEVRQFRARDGQDYPGPEEWKRREAVDAAERDHIIKPRAKAWEVTYTAEFTRKDILEAALEDLKGPAVLTGVGVVCGAAGSALSMWA